VASKPSHRSARERASLRETEHLLRSPRNAQRLIEALRDVKGGSIKPQTVEQFRKDVGLPKG